jgi:SAM-dependent methyltransferase
VERVVFDQLNRLEADHWWFVARRNILSGVIGRVLPDKAGNVDRAILEAGCGTGGNLEMLSGFGTVRAFEPDADARDIARAKKIGEIEAGTLPGGIPFEGTDFDLITAFDVLEHVEPDRESLAALGNRLAPQGRIVLTVPALPWMWSEHDVRHHHYRRYTRQSLAETIRAAGLKLHKITYFNTVLFPVVAGVRATKNLLGLDSAHDDRLPAGPINTLLCTLFSAEKPLVANGSLPIGVSLLAVAGRTDSPNGR